MTRGWEVATLEEIAGPRSRHGFDWHPVRRRFGIASFGANANSAREAGDVVVDEHDEAHGDGGQEELYVVVRGRALFVVGGQEIEASAGTFLFVRDPAVHQRVCNEIAAFLAAQGWSVGGVAPSPILGGDGNREFFIEAERG